MRDTPSAAERARWLAEVAQALDDARLLAERLGATGGQTLYGRELLHRIEDARRTTLALRLASDRRSARLIRPE